MDAGRDLLAAGPATLRLYELAGGLASSHGLDPDGSIPRRLAGELRAHGLRQVEQIEVTLPIGEWPQRLGSLVISDVRAGFTCMAPAMHEIGVDREELARLLTTALAEGEKLQTRHIAYLALCRRPARVTSPLTCTDHLSLLQASLLRRPPTLDSGASGISLRETPTKQGDGMNRFTTASHRPLRGAGHNDHEGNKPHHISLSLGNYRNNTTRTRRGTALASQGRTAVGQTTRVLVQLPNRAGIGRDRYPPIPFGAG